MSLLSGSPRRSWSALLLITVCLLLFLPGQSSLPPVDRDEARFAQATRQMIESGDYVDVRFQDEPRYQKPIGAYWLQAACVLLSGKPSEIWAYRIPSWIAATAAVVLTWSVASCFVMDGWLALLAGLLLASTVLLGIEARLAKADAILLLCTVSAQAILARAYLGRTLTLLSVLVCWSALGAGVLVKGPMILFVVGATAAVLSTWERRVDWLKSLRPVLGISVMITICAPWLIAISLRTGSEFWKRSLGQDLGGKLLSVQESHGGPPGYYLVSVFFTFWPWSFLLIPAGIFAYRHRDLPIVRFCVAWILPTWLCLELVPTKLPHYPLPLFPPLAILCATSVCKMLWPARWVRIAGWHAVFLILTGVCGLAAAVIWLAPQLSTPVLASSLFTLLALSLAALIRKSRVFAGSLTMAALIGLYASYFGLLLPRMDSLWLSRSAARLLHQHGSPRLMSIGYAEPSLVFLTSTETRLVPLDTKASKKADEWMRKGLNYLVLLPSAQLPGVSEPYVELGRVNGLNYSKGQKLELVLVRSASEGALGLDVAGGEARQPHDPERDAKPK